MHTQSADDDEAFLEACKGGNLPTATRLATPEHVHRADEDGYRPIHWACRNGHLAIVELLLSHGAQPDVKTNGGSTPIHWACDAGHLAIVKLLHSRGAPLDVKNNDGRTPLSWAQREGHTAVVEWLQVRSAHTRP